MYQGLKISWFGHDAFRIENSKTVYTDPYQVKGGKVADIILVTHDHYDHLRPDDIRRVLGTGTAVVAAEHCGPKLSSLGIKDLKLVKAGDRASVGSVTIEVVPAYNVNKFREAGRVYHPREYGGVGFMITLDGVRVYHAGDTDQIPEMSMIRADIAMLPVSGVYVMTAEEAGKAAKMLKPKVALPMHYGAIVGGLKDAELFSRTAGCEVKILSKE